MPPKKAAKKADKATSEKSAVQAEPAAAAGSEATLTKKYDAELKELASKARSDASTMGNVVMLLRAAAIILLTGTYSSAAVQALSPVYGTIPSGAYHYQLVVAGSFVGWASNLAIRANLPYGMKAWHLLPVLTAWTPVIQNIMCRFSDTLGAKYGPMLTQALTVLPVAIFSATSVADQFEHADLSEWLPGPLAEAVPGLISWSVLQATQGLSGSLLQQNAGKALVLTRVALQTTLSAAFAVLAPSKWLVMAVPALLHTVLLNTHVMTPGATASLNQTLIANNWTLLDRQESVTGYISVLESNEMGYRVLRCDHSLLGGEWVFIQGHKASEPIYGVFVMLEAVRLMETANKPADKDASALVIGLGIGTTPSAFVEHGISTTVVEIDPVVHEYATKYFHLKENNPPAIEDALRYTASQVKAGVTYDYIVHDVFTGGAEPADLFTLEFFQGLSDLLKPNGAIAINYAGDFSLEAPKIVVKTILEVFPTCRMFRESPPSEDLKEGDPDFTNMVIFCQKSADALKFRPPVVEDFLQSRARQFFLEPRHEVNAVAFLDEKEADPDAQQEAVKVDVLRKGSTLAITKYHRQSAHGHWNVIRTVIPPKIWEMW